MYILELTPDPHCTHFAIKIMLPVLLIFRDKKGARNSCILLMFITRKELGIHVSSTNYYCIQYSHILRKCWVISVWIKKQCASTFNTKKLEGCQIRILICYSKYVHTNSCLDSHRSLQNICQCSYFLKLAMLNIIKGNEITRSL